MSHRAAALTLALAFLALHPAPSEGGHVPPRYSLPFTVAADTPEGVLVYRVANPAGLSHHFDATFRISSYNHTPFHVAAVNATGHVRIASFLPDASGGFAGDGNDAAYAGLGGTGANAPPARTADRTQSLDGFRDFGSTTGWLVFVWKDQGGPWEYRSLWPEGTTFELVAAGTVDTYSHRNLQKGTRAGIPPALVAIQDGVTLQTHEGQTFGWIAYDRSDYVGWGEMAVVHAGQRHSLDLRQYPTPDDLCYCGEKGRWIFTSHVPVEVEYDAVQFRGDGRFYVVAIHLPRDTLPDNVWQETVLWPRNQPIP